MLGAVCGDIIGSPFDKVNTDDRYFEMCRSNRGWYHGRETTFHPRISDNTVMTLAVARWLMLDADRTTSRLLSTMKAMHDENLSRGISYGSDRWAEREFPYTRRRDDHEAAIRATPIALVVDDLAEALSLAERTVVVTHSHPDALNSAQALVQAVWMARHGRSKEDIRFAMENDFGFDLSPSGDELGLSVRGYVKEPIIINGEESGEYYFKETGKASTESRVTVAAALSAFLSGDSFEDAVRRSVALGGRSSGIAAMTAAVSEPFFGGIPEKIRGLCDEFVPPELKNPMEIFERVMMHKDVFSGKITKERDDSFKVIRQGDTPPVYVVSGERKDIIAALKEKFGDGIAVLGPRTAQEYIAAHGNNSGKDGTYLEEPRLDIRTVYYKDGVFHSPTTYPFEGGRDKHEKDRAFADFQKIKEYAKDVKSKLQSIAGYGGDGNVHFGTAYYPVILHSKVEIWKGDIFAGSIGIDTKSGMLKIEEGGDMGPAEWGEDRCFSVFFSTDVAAAKEAMYRFCLDDGVDLNRASERSNVQRAYEDVAKSDIRDDIKPDTTKCERKAEGGRQILGERRKIG